MTIFETKQEEEDKIVTPLFLITDPLILYKTLDFSWEAGQTKFLRHEPTVFPLSVS